jgi:hypothetical protein
VTVKQSGWVTVGVRVCVTAINQEVAQIPALDLQAVCRYGCLRQLGNYLNGCVIRFSLFL